MGWLIDLISSRKVFRSECKVGGYEEWRGGIIMERCKSRFKFKLLWCVLRFIIVIVLLLGEVLCGEEVSPIVVYQGRVLKNGVPIEGTWKVRFEVVSCTSTPDTVQWDSGNVDVEFRNGLFRYVLQPTGVDWRGMASCAKLRIYIDDKEMGEEHILAFPYAIYTASANYAFTAGSVVGGAADKVAI